MYIWDTQRVYQWLPNFTLGQNHLEGLPLNIWIQEVWTETETCISNKSPGNADAWVQDHTLRNTDVWQLQSSGEIGWCLHFSLWQEKGELAKSEFKATCSFIRVYLAIRQCWYPEAQGYLSRPGVEDNDASCPQLIPLCHLWLHWSWWKLELQLGKQTGVRLGQ